MAFKHPTLIRTCAIVLAAGSLAACDEAVDPSQLADPDPVGRYLLVDTRSGVIAIDSAMGKTWHLVDYGSSEEGPVLQWEEIRGR